MQDTPRLNDSAEKVALYIIDEKMSGVVEFSLKTRSFRLKLSSSELPPDVALALKICTKETSSVFGGKQGVRLRLLSAALLTSKTVTTLRQLTVSHKFSDWAEKWHESKVMNWNFLAQEFRKHASR